jgi:hypothetical protein
MGVKFNNDSIRITAEQRFTIPRQSDQELYPKYPKDHPPQEYHRAQAADNCITKTKNIHHDYIYGPYTVHLVDNILIEVMYY